MSLWRRDHTCNVTTLTYHQPPRNFLTGPALQQLQQLLEAEAGVDNTHVVVLTSDVPDYFIAHADLHEIIALTEGRPGPHAKYWYTAIKAIEDLPQPVIAAINGQCWGGGLELALACSLRIASADAHFCLPETSLGLIPGAGGTQRLARLLGAGRANQIILSGEIMTAQDAASLGLVNAVTAASNLAEHVQTFAGKLARQPRTALAAAKRAVVDGLALPVSEGQRLEGVLFSQTLQTAECRARVAAAIDRYATAPPAEHVTFPLS